MKKLCILMAVLLLLGLTACGEKPEPAPEPEKPAVETPAEPEQTPVEEPEEPVEEQPEEEPPVEEEPAEEPEEPAEDVPSAEEETNPLFEQALALIDCSVEELYDTVGMPIDYMYAESCLGEGEDGELYYDGFTVYTYRDLEDNEHIYDVMENRD